MNLMQGLPEYPGSLALAFYFPLPAAAFHIAILISGIFRPSSQSQFLEYLTTRRIYLIPNLPIFWYWALYDFNCVVVQHYIWWKLSHFFHTNSFSDMWSLLFFKLQYSNKDQTFKNKKKIYFLQFFIKKIFNQNSS